MTKNWRANIRFIGNSKLVEVTLSLEEQIRDQNIYKMYTLVQRNSGVRLYEETFLASVAPKKCLKDSIHVEEQVVFVVCKSED